jgi:ketosteroid isomerase-like protein/mannose-6-phosphate isomerase-like protein (cupin superfamily)
MEIIEGAGAWAHPGGADNDWVEQLRASDLSVGTYCIPAGGQDTQSPHTEDEIYVVTAGQAKISTPGRTDAVGPGAVIFVPAGEEHRFTDVTEDLALLVVFGPAFGSRAVESPGLGPREVLARYQQAMLDKSADDLADLYAVDAVHEFPFLSPGMPERFRGREEVRAGYRAAWGASPAQPREIREVVVQEGADPEVIVVEQTVSGTVTTTGRSFDLPGLLVIRVRNGEIVHVRDYMDGLGVAHAMDRLPAVAAALDDRS